jgi:hypothetical protein
MELDKLTTAIAILLGVTGLPTTSAAADDAPEPRVAMQVGGGLEYDSNVAVLELDTSANAGDTKRVFDFGVAYDMRERGPFDFKAGYNYSATMHGEFDAFDMQIHRMSSTLSYDLGRTDTGLVLQHAEAMLDGTDFLTLTQLSPYVSQLVGQRVFLRFAYVDTDKDFDGNVERAAQATGLSSDVYVFLNGVKTYLMFGIRHDDEDAFDSTFDYSGRKLRAQVSHRIALGARNLTLKVGVRSEQRDYDNETPSIAAERRDHRVMFEASGELTLTDRITSRLEYSNADNRSNLPSIDFREQVVVMAFTASF